MIIFHILHCKWVPIARPAEIREWVQEEVSVLYGAGVSQENAKFINLDVNWSISGHLSFRDILKSPNGIYKIVMKHEANKKLGCRRDTALS